MKWTKEYRAAYMRAYREKHREWLRTLYGMYYDKYRDDICRRARKRYASDPVYRAHMLAQQRVHRKAKKENTAK